MYKEAYTDLPFSVGKSLYVAIPPFIIYGLCESIYAALAFGLKAEMTPYVSETTLFDDVGKYDFATAAPIHYRYMYNKLVELQGAKKETVMRKKLSRVKCFISGGDKITVQELLRMQQFFEVPIINGYGNNELTGGAVISPVYASKPDSVGIPMKDIIVTSFDINTYENLENGNEGEICIKSDSIFECYLKNEDETERVKQLHSDGAYWIHTGDLGYIDEDGYVYITGRTKRLIKREAFKIAPDTIENLIMTVENVRDCVVVGVPDTEHEGSQVPMAYVEVDLEGALECNTTIEKIRQKCVDELPDYEVPKYIEVIEKIPYKNTKHNFKLLEAMGNKYIESLVEE